MSWKTRTIFAATAVMVMLSFAVMVQAVEPRPEPEKIKKLSFPKFNEFELKNGIEGLVVEHHEQPVVSIYVLFKSGDAVDPAGKEALAGFTIDQLNKGTETKSALELAKWIESVGGSVNGWSTGDYSAVSVGVLAEHLDVAYDYLQDILLHPTFPQEELDLVAKRIKTALELELSQPAAVGQRQLRNLVYGDHPYAKQPTVESVEAITRDDVVNFYKTNLVPNNVMIAVVGDVKWKNVKKSLESRLGGWEPGTPQQVTYSGAPEASDTQIFLYNKTGAVQTEIFIGHLAPDATNPDWPAIVVGNRILGGGSSSRLFTNIRETKGWTYSIRTGFSREKDLGIFTARTPVRTEVTDSVLVELMSELERITKEPVTEEELNDAKSYLVGNFPITIETPDQIAMRVTRYKLLGLDQKDLEGYRDRMNAVTIEDVSRVMDEYLHPDKAYVVLVGDGQQIAEKVEVVADVEMFDLTGEPVSLELMAVQPVDYDYDTSKITTHSATYSLTAQGMAIGDMNVQVEKGEDVVAVSSKIEGMLVMEENQEFRVKDLSPVAYRASMQMGPQTMGAEFTFTETSCKGTVKDMGSPEPKEVSFDLIGGTILDGTVEYAITCLTMEVGKTYRFPVVDSQTGSVQNADAEILEVIDVETPAGKFSTFKVKIKRADGESYLYYDTISPHLLVKQEVPAQGILLELKSAN